MTHVVKWPHRYRVVYHKNIIASPGFSDIFTQQTLALWIEIAFPLWRVALFRQHGQCLGHRDPRKRQRRHREFNAVIFGNRVTISFPHGINDMLQPRFFERHHILVTINPCNLDIHTGKLRRMARGK